MEVFIVQTWTRWSCRKQYERIWNVLEMEGFYRRTEQRCLSVFPPADILWQVFLVTGTTVCVIECIKTPCARWIPVQ